ERPRCHRAAEQCDELAAFELSAHSITSSARQSSARSSRKRLLNARRVASGDPLGIVAVAALTANAAEGPAVAITATFLSFSQQSAERLNCCPVFTFREKTS